MICVSVGEKNYNIAIEIAALYNFAEIRLDLLEKVDKKITEKIFSSHKNLIATYRKNSESEKERLLILKTAIENRAAYIDVDINESCEFISAIRQLCESNNLLSKKDGKNTKLIISYHNYYETPKLNILDKIITDAINKGADIVKIACAAKTAIHVERLLSIPDYYNYIKIVIAGMGEMGGRVRILSEAAGSFFTYASHNIKNCTAEGQLDYKTILEEQRKIVSGW